MNLWETLINSINTILNMEILGLFNLGHILLFVLVLITFVGIFVKMRI